MPANLTPQYLEAETQFKQAKTAQDKVKALEVMMAVIPKHKGTERLRGQLKSRMAKLKQEMQRKPTVGKSEFLYNVRREGAGQVVLLGLPNSGKSSLLMTGRSLDWHCPRVEMTESLEMGATYKVEAWVRSAGTDGKFRMIVLSRYPDRDKEDAVADNVAGTAKGWPYKDGNLCGLREIFSIHSLHREMEKRCFNLALF